jgi:GNAT superfamily N-acetyltransferase
MTNDIHYLRVSRALRHNGGMIDRTAADIQYERASALTLDAFAELFTRSFADYFYPMTHTAAILATRLRQDHLDLHHSVVMRVDGALAGQAMLGIRGLIGWCGGFGVVPAFRGRGLAHGLFDALVARAREAGLRELWLEALTRNTSALAVYTRGGMRIVRDVIIYEWKRGEHPTAPVAGVWDADRPEDLLHSFARLHPVPAQWNRDLPELIVTPDLSGIGIGDRAQPNAYALYKPSQRAVRIIDLAARDAASALPVLHALQTKFDTVRSVNEPSDSPATAAFLESGFVETDRQHVLTMTL